MAAALFAATEEAFQRNDVSKPGAAFNTMKQVVDKLENLGMLSAMDVVLNHCSDNAEWIRKHPECTYNLTNCSHLTSAWELDRGLQDFSNRLAENKVHGCSNNIRTEQDVETVLNTIRDQVINPLKIHEFFQIDVRASVEAWKASKEVYIGCNDLYESLRAIVLPLLGAQRKPVVISGDALRKVVHKDAEHDLWGNLERIRGEAERLSWGMPDAIIGALRGLIRYERLECPKGLVGYGADALVPNYFHEIDCADGSKAVVACNGWVMNWDAERDFAAPNWEFVYLQRHLCSWGDCVKLRYGDCPDDAPYLWEYMTKYAVDMANIFHAIRLDNAHATPLHVSHYILAKVRQARPDVWIFAELFTGNGATDLHYQSYLGLNALVREALHAGHPRELSYQISQWGGHPVGFVSPVGSLDRHAVGPGMTNSSTQKGSFSSINTSAVPIHPRRCPALLYDQTHDNQSIVTKRTAADTLSTLAVVAACPSAIASTRGYDEIYKTNPSVVKETRTYRKLSITPNDHSNLTKDFEFQTEEKVEEEPIKREITWSGGGTRVVVRGEWDGWQHDLPLHKRGNNPWKVQLPATAKFPVMYKFVIDGHWCIDHTQPTCESGGQQNNVMGLEKSDLKAVFVPKHEEGILGLRQVLNYIHQNLSHHHGVTIEHLADDIISIRRHNPDSHHSVYFLIRTAFWKTGEGLPPNVGSLRLDGPVKRVLFAATLYVNDHDVNNFKECVKELHGVPVFMRPYTHGDELMNFQSNAPGQMEARLHHFPPGSVCVFETEFGVQSSLRELGQLCTMSACAEFVKKLDLRLINNLLYSCAAEESDRIDRGAYHLNEYGDLIYCGLTGSMAVFDQIRNGGVANFDAPLMLNVREGDWLLQYLRDRCESEPGLDSERLGLSA